MTDMPQIKVRYLNQLTLVEIANEKISNFDEALIDGIDKTLFWVIQENAPIRMILSFSQVAFFDSAVIITLLRLKKRVAESDGISAYDYVDGRATNRRTVAAGLPDAESPDLRGAYAHALKSVTIGPDGAVYFSIGSTGNISAEDRDATPPRATIMRVPPGGGPAEPFATGVRNGTGLAIAPDGSVWTAVNGRDNVADPATGEVDPEYVNDHPPEQLAKLTPGRELGWPYCNIDGGPADVPFIRDVQTNPDGDKLDCAALPPVEQSFGAHSAPLGLNFVDGELPEPYARGGLVGIHGSWNRRPPREPEVSFYPWRDGDLGNQQTLVGGFQADDGSRWGRPVDAVAGPDGAVYITDDDAGAVYRLAPPGR